MKNTLVAAFLYTVSICASDAVLSTGTVPTTYSFSGTLNGPFGSLASGTPFSGTFTYDSTQALNTPFTNRGDYLYLNFGVTILQHTVIDGGTGVINMYNNPGYPTDLFHLYTYNVFGSFGGITLEPGAGMQLVLQDNSGTVFNDLGILKPNLTLADFTTGNGTFLELRGLFAPDQLGEVPLARGQLTSLKAVPEPCSLIVTATFSGWLLMRRRRPPERPVTHRRRSGRDGENQFVQMNQNQRREAGGFPLAIRLRRIFRQPVGCGYGGGLHPQSSTASPEDDVSG